MDALFLYVFGTKRVLDVCCIGYGYRSLPSGLQGDVHYPQSVIRLTNGIISPE